MKKEELFTLYELYHLLDQRPFTAIKVRRDEGYHVPHTQLDVRASDGDLMYYVDCAGKLERMVIQADHRSWLVVP